MADTTKKIIRGVVNSRGFTITSPITQWDYGWQFIPEIEDLPATYRLDFSNEENKGTALPIYCSTEGAEVPTELIDTGKDIHVWLFCIGEGYGITEYHWRIPNKCKPKTEQDEPTPSQQSSIDQAISVVNEAVETVEQKASEADQSAQSASQDASRAERAKTSSETAQGKAEEAQESAERAKDGAETSERNASESERKAKGYADTASEKADSITGLTAQATTLPDGSSATANYNPETGVMSFGIPKGKDGTNGDDGYSPTANVSKSGKTTTVTITDKNGTTSAQVEDGTDGTDGISPTVTITPITGGHRITITDADGEHSADVMDGTGSVDDVQINGTSIVEDGVANVPLASESVHGATKYATASEIKSGGGTARSINPYRQHESTFYGLAKAASDTTQSASSNAVGVYTDEAKIAIQKMLGINQQGELIADITATEDVTEFLVATDLNGLAFELRKIIVLFSANPSTTGARDSFYTQVFCKNRSDVNVNISCPSITYPTATSNLIARVTVDAFNDMPIIETEAVAGSDGNTVAMNTMIKTVIAKALTGFRIYQSGATKSLIPSGSNIKVYGIRS